MENKIRRLRRTVMGLLLTSSMALAPGACMVRASADTQISGGQNGRQAENAQSTERINSIESSDSSSESVYSNSTDEASEPDFSSCRLLVLTSGDSVIRSTDKVLSDYQGSYILQFDTPEEAEGAYQYYTKRADCVEPDSASIRAASEAAGNDGRDAKYNIPGGIDEAVIAGAVNDEDQRTGKTNYGSTVDYYVVSGSTSEAAARLSGIYSRTGSFTKQGTVFTSVLDESKSSDEEQSEDGSDQKPEKKGSIQVKVISETENGKIIDVNGIWFLASRDFDTSVPWKMTDADAGSAELTAAAADLSPVACQSVNHSYGYTTGDTDKEVAFVNGTGGQGLFNFGGIQSGMLNVSTAYSLMTNTGTEFYGKPHDDAFCIEEGQIFHTSWQKTTDLVGA